MVLPLLLTVFACLAVAWMTRPIVTAFVSDDRRASKLEMAAITSMLAAVIVGGWSAFVLAIIVLKNLIN